MTVWIHCWFFGCLITSDSICTHSIFSPFTLLQNGKVWRIFIAGLLKIYCLKQLPILNKNNSIIRRGSFFLLHSNTEFRVLTIVFFWIWNFLKFFWHKMNDFVFVKWKTVFPFAIRFYSKELSKWIATSIPNLWANAKRQQLRSWTFLRNSSSAPWFWFRIRVRMKFLISSNLLFTMITSKRCSLFVTLLAGIIFSLHWPSATPRIRIQRSQSDILNDKLDLGSS